MSSVVAELEAALQAMLTLKPPGVSGSKISSITALCTSNVQVNARSPSLDRLAPPLPALARPVVRSG